MIKEKFMKTKSLLALLFTLPLIACNKSGTAPKEISKEEAMDRAANYNVDDVINHCGRAAIVKYKISFSDKYGMFKNFTDEQIYGTLTGEDVHNVQDEAEWLVISQAYISYFDEEITWFYASGKSGLKIRFKHTDENDMITIHATDTEYHFDAAIDETYTIGNYGQLTKYTATNKYTLLTSYYPEIPDSGFTMHWNETYTYTNELK